jgi:DNA-binding XRE family transcriptional regulator
MNGKEIRKHREEIGYSRQQLGDAIGVSQSTIYNWESGVSVPSEEHSTSLAAEFNKRPAMADASRIPDSKLTRFIGCTIKIVKADQYTLGIDEASDEAVVLEKSAN